MPTAKPTGIIERIALHNDLVTKITGSRFSDPSAGLVQETGQYKDSVEGDSSGLGDALKAFDNFNKRTSVLAGLRSVTLPDGRTFAAVEKAAASGSPLILTSLTVQGAAPIQDAIGRFKRHATFIDGKLKKGEMTPFDAASYMTAVRNDTFKKLDERYAEEKKQIEGMCDHPHFKTAGAPDPDGAKKAMLSALDEAHKKEKGDIEKNINDKIQSLTKNQELEAMRLEYLIRLYKMDKHFKQYVDEKYQERQAQTVKTTTITKGSALRPDLFKDISVKEAAEFSLNFGSGFQKQGDAYVFQGTLDEHHYHHIAAVMRAEGKQKITITIDDPHNPKDAKKNAQKAYAAFAAAGYSDDQINITVNGKQVCGKSADDKSINPQGQLFDNAGGKFQKIKDTRDALNGLRTARDKVASTQDDTQVLGKLNQINP